MNLLEKMFTYPTVERGPCRDCGNKWWFDQGKQGWVCTTCGKTHAKSSSGESEPQTETAEETK